MEETVNSETNHDKLKKEVSQLVTVLKEMKEGLDNVTAKVQVLTDKIENGGLAVWETVVGNRVLESLNPTEFFKGVVVEIEYPECTSSAIKALVLFKKLRPGH